MERRQPATKSGWQRYGHLLWWLLLPVAGWVFYRSNIAHHSMAKPTLPPGTITIPLQPDSSDMVSYIYKPLPFTIQVNDTMKEVLEERESFVYIAGDSCWLEHVLKGHVYVQHKDSIEKGTIEIQDKRPLPGFKQQR